MVIAIIGILAGLLMPALAKARESAKAATCLNNFKQIGTGLAAYQADHAGWLPYSTETFPYDFYAKGDRHLKTNASFVGHLDYYYLHTILFKEIKKDGTFELDNSDEDREVNRRRIKGEAWACPVNYPNKNVYTKGDEKSRLGIVLYTPNNMPVGKDKKKVWHSFMRNSNGGNADGKYKNISTAKTAAPLEELALMAESCYATSTAGQDTNGRDHAQQGKSIPNPHNNGATVLWGDLHASLVVPPKGYGLNPAMVSGSKEKDYQRFIKLDAEPPVPGVIE